MAAGRPVDEAKTTAMLDAARAHFFSRGYEGTRLDQVAADAGVSKVTIYNRFGDKAGLLSACVSAECERMQAEMALDSADCRSFTERLNRFGFTLLTFIFSPEHIGFDRMISTEGVRSPQLAHLFFDAGPRRMQSLLQSLLETGIREGLIAADDVQEASTHLLGLWKGMADMHLRFAQPYDRDSSQLAARIARATNRFLRAYAP
jgi:TetR/AcrR family transcriptional repressor of mexJK operon